MADAFEIQVPSNPKYAKIVRCSVDHVCDLCGFSGKTRRAITLAVDEAFTNIIRHAYLGDTGKTIFLRCRIRDDRLDIVLQDKGLPGDPGQMKSRRLEDVRPGGLGLHLITSTMDKVEYRSTQANGNVLTLTKFLPENRKDHVEN